MGRSNDGLLAVFLILLVVLIVIFGAYLFIRANDAPKSYQPTVTYIPAQNQVLEVPSFSERTLQEKLALENRVRSLEQQNLQLESSLEASRLENVRLNDDDRFRFRFDNDDCDDDCEEEIEDLEDEVDDLEDTIDELCEELDDEGIDHDEC